MKWKFPASLVNSILAVLLIVQFLAAPQTMLAAPDDASIRHVTTNGGSSGECMDMSWNAPCTLQYALSVAQSSDEIWVAAGTYLPAADGDQDVSFALKSGVAVYGGFAGNELVRDSRNWRSNVTILSGDLLENDSGAARWDNPTYSDNSYHVVTANEVDNTAILDGFTISGGHAAGGTFGNEPMSGGGISLLDSKPVFSNLIVAGNTSASSASGGGLMVSETSGAWLTNVLFSGNQAGFQGGAINNYFGDLVLTNVTFSGNRAEDQGGAITSFFGSMQIHNSIIWGNVAPNNPSILSYPHNVYVKNTDIEDGQDFCQPIGGVPSCDSTILFDNPNFINAPGSDGIYGTQDDNPRPASNSPVINQGNNTFIDPQFQTTDLDGLPRIVGDNVDMGAFEYQGAVTLTVNVTGSGSVTQNPLPPYLHGASVELTAVPATGWYFLEWTGDLSGSVNPETITLNGNKTVTAVFEQNANHPPVSHNQAFETFRNVPLSSQLEASDMDGDALTFQKFGDVLFGNVVLSENGNFVYTPDANFIGTDKFQFTVWDHIDSPVGPYTATITVKSTIFLPLITR